MLLERQILQTIEQQKAIQDKVSDGIIRDLKPALESLSSHALILSGIRRCGKSTLLLQISRQMDNSKWVYLNFESPALYGFSLSDFAKLDSILNRTGVDTLFFDEFQIVDKWELYVRQKLDERKKVIVTGSNASMLNTELGTRLTGRHISQLLFPFSSTSKTNETDCFPSFLTHAERMSQPAKRKGSEAAPALISSEIQTAPSAVFGPS